MPPEIAVDSVLEVKAEGAGAELATGTLAYDGTTAVAEPMVEEEMSVEAGAAEGVTASELDDGDESGKLSVVVGVGASGV